MCSRFLWILVISSHLQNNYGNNADVSSNITWIIEIESLTNTRSTADSLNVGSLGAYIIGAQYLAFSAINNDSSILPDYQLCLSIKNTYNKRSETIKKAIEIADISTLRHPDNEDAVIIPILLGAPSSTMSVLTNPILNAFNWAQISSSATSTQLSQSTYPSFFRTVPDDDIQAKTLVWICEEFNWTSVAVVYAADSYGVYMSNAVHDFGSRAGITTHTISYVSDPLSIQNAAQRLLAVPSFIVILILNIASAADLFAALNEYNLLTFPYFYLGVDSWFQTQRILAADINNYTKGFIGTVPWQPTALTYDAYANFELDEVYIAAKDSYDRFVQQWQNALESNDEFNTILGFLDPYMDEDEGGELFDIYAIYGWDSAMAVALAIDEYDRLYNLENILDESIENVSMRLQSILRNESFWFLSMTGNVSFHPNGNRRYGLYSLGNIVDNNGDIEYFGVWADHLNITADTVADECGACALPIIWPDEFVEYGLIPRPHKLVQHQTIYIDEYARIVIHICCALSMCLVLFTIFLQWRWRENVIIKAASWKLNIFTCVGCLLSLVTVILYGIQPNDILCNIREWILIISFSLVFLPLFLKTYRISIIFTGMLTVKNITDFQLIIGILVCLTMDVVILSIFTALELEQAMPINGPIYNVHPLLDIQQEYTYCMKRDERRLNNLYLLVMGLWKATILVFGLSVALIVSKSNTLTKFLQKFNETNSQIFAIMFTGVICVLIGIPVLFGAINEPTSFYLLVGSCSLLITNVVLAANVLQRLWAVWRCKEDKFKLHQEDIFQNDLMNLFKKRTTRSLMNIVHEIELLHVHEVSNARNVLQDVDTK